MVAIGLIDEDDNPVYFGFYDFYDEDDELNEEVSEEADTEAAKINVEIIDTVKDTIEEITTSDKEDDLLIQIWKQ